MTNLGALRARLTRDRASANTSQPPDDARPGSAEGPHLPFVGYDRLNHKQVIDGLSDHSQIELEAVETYERSHQGREPVLDKLRYMRGPEPLPGYDALSVGEIAAALEQSNLVTVKKVRSYERKFAKRPDVLEQAVRVHHRRQAALPADAPPAYQPLSATSAAPPQA